MNERDYSHLYGQLNSLGDIKALCGEGNDMVKYDTLMAIYSTKQQVLLAIKLKDKAYLQWARDCHAALFQPGAPAEGTLLVKSPPRRSHHHQQQQQQHHHHYQQQQQQQQQQPAAGGFGERESLMVAKARRENLPPCVLARAVVKIHLQHHPELVRGRDAEQGGNGEAARDLDDQIEDDQKPPAVSSSSSSSSSSSMSSSTSTPFTSSYSSSSSKTLVEKTVRRFMEYPAEIPDSVLKFEVEQCLLHDHISSPRVTRLKQYSSFSPFIARRRC